MIDSKLFRKAMGRFATGITVVSTLDQKTEEVKGITVNAFMSISLDPYLIAISIRNQSSMITQLNENDQFGVSVLGEDQEKYSMIFANQIKSDQPVEFDWVDNTPVLPDALVQLVCEKESEVVAGDHTVYIAKVKKIVTKEGDPLIYYNGEYRELN
ncbi:flavin reductase family protein [Amphibacillus xylanus]|uniref:Putative oxidoreductase n=1 Tax=Amphibacillus xylanus (strain ATCC 51415 / DSM 6626 / JCM 7361 / LMG 17667 / NBRC 15112 / Ep01) TaxID=698758 RepID=K0J4A3_AMPXN|nr:flavin reductase family protein [Amphibacillus xylanus]BAM47481.1 putative oxidoreductase [Amphibacillus xylanus NBRC 15112]